LNITGNQSFNDFKPIRNTYEANFTFDLTGSSDQNFGINFCVKRMSKVILGYNAATSYEGDSNNLYLLYKPASGKQTFRMVFRVVSSK
jgi:hypothetical protein